MTSRLPDSRLPRPRQETDSHKKGDNTSSGEKRANVSRACELLPHTTCQSHVGPLKQPESCLGDLTLRWSVRTATNLKGETFNHYFIKGIPWENHT